MKKSKNLCPCDSGKIFTQCCSPFLTGEAIPLTALQLMRSRYCAYTMAKIEYIEQTMGGKAAKDYDVASAKQWASQVIWCGLNILDPGQQQAALDTDEVEFAARYISGNTLYILHERSQFQKIADKWFYIFGTLIPHPPTRITHEVLCPCGSRKKFSKCCGGNIT